jgi:hypothetical protein
LPSGLERLSASDAIIFDHEHAALSWGSIVLLENDMSLNLSANIHGATSFIAAVT